MKYTWKETGHGATDNLGKQMQKIVRTMNQNKFNTRWRYIAAEKRFLSYIAKEFKVQKLTNVKDSHLEKYATDLKEKDKADKYIKNELAAIRFFHNHTPDTKYNLADATVFNKSIGLRATPDGRADRAWTEKEIEKMKEKAMDLNRVEIVRVIEAVRATGMRIDEVCSIKWQHINNALKTGNLKIDGSVGKGGVHRNIPVTDRARAVFEKVIKNIERGGYVFTPKNYIESNKIHRFEKNIQNFIGYHRQKIQDPDRTNTGHNVAAKEKSALTTHGLRHSFAREQYFKFRENGLSRDTARLEVSHMLGHGRDSVTYIYLGGLQEDE